MKKVIAAMVSTAMLPLAACGNSADNAATTNSYRRLQQVIPRHQKVGFSGADGADHTQRHYSLKLFCHQSIAGDVAGDQISQTEGMIYFCKQNRERSGTRVHTDIHTDGQLASSTQNILAVPKMARMRYLC